MDLIKINGGTYYIDGATNVGLFVFKNKFCLMVDTCINTSGAKKLDAVISQNGFHPKYIINTHNHKDHCYGNAYFKETYPGLVTYASGKEKLLIENPDLRDLTLYSAANIKDTVDSKICPVDCAIDKGTNKIADAKFEIIALPGHSTDQIGVVTEDKVCFLGDSLFSDDIMEKYKLPYFIDIKKALESLDTIKEIDADYFVAGHINKVLDKGEIIILSQNNIDNINRNIDEITVFLEQPMTREDLLENLIVYHEMPVKYSEYFVYLASLSGFLNYLLSKNRIQYSIESGKLFYYAK